MSSRRVWFAAAGLVLTGWLATGFAVVQQDEVGVVRSFGAVRGAPWPPGLHWGLPWGLGRVDRVSIDRARTVSVGARGLQSAPLSRAPDPGLEDFLTGDLNLASAQAIVQFRVADPVRYLFETISVDKAVGLLAEAALTRALAARGIDDVLTSGRAEVAEEISREVQTNAESQKLGIAIRAVRLGRVTPPTPVAPAFIDADRARSDKRQAVTRAEEYRDGSRADSRGRARETRDRAAAVFEERVQIARGEADRFTKLLGEARKNPRAVRQRLYLETVAELFPRFNRKVVVAPGRDVDLSVFEK
jgi:membrane protease subunit HflK